MPTVTGTLTDIGLGALAPFNPVLQFAPSEPAVLADGTLFATRPVEVTPAADGTFSVTLATTDGVRPTRTRWLLSIGWRNPDGYMSGAGYFSKDFPSWSLRVPSGGGALSELIDLAPEPGVFYVGNEAPDPDAGYRIWFDTSGAELQMKGWQ